MAKVPSNVKALVSVLRSMAARQCVTHFGGDGTVFKMLARSHREDRVRPLQHEMQSVLQAIGAKADINFWDRNDGTWVIEMQYSAFVPNKHWAYAKRHGLTDRMSHRHLEEAFGPQLVSTYRVVKVGVIRDGSFFVK